MGARIVDPSQGNKTAFFKAIDSIGNNASAQQLLAFKEKLERGLPLLELYESVERRQGVEETRDKEHVAIHWLGTAVSKENPPWWPELNPEEKLRKGIIDVITLQLETNPPRKVDYWWVVHTDGFRIIPCVRGARITVIVLTPPPPAGALSAS